MNSYSGNTSIEPQYEGPKSGKNKKGAYNAKTQQDNPFYENRGAPAQSERSLAKFGPKKNRLNW